MEPTFFSWYVNKIDAKGRVSVPASFRDQIDRQSYNGICAIPSSKHPMVEGSDRARTQKISRQLRSLPEFSEAYETVQQMFGDIVLLPLDPEGRIILPGHLLAHANLKDAVLFSGAGDLFQMWEPKAYEEYRQIQRERRKSGNVAWAPVEPAKVAS